MKKLIIRVLFFFIIMAVGVLNINGQGNIYIDNISGSMPVTFSSNITSNKYYMDGGNYYSCFDMQEINTKLFKKTICSSELVSVGFYESSSNKSLSINLKSLVFDRTQLINPLLEEFPLSKINSFFFSDQSHVFHCDLIDYNGNGFYKCSDFKNKGFLSDFYIESNLLFNNKNYHSIISYGSSTSVHGRFIDIESKNTPAVPPSACSSVPQYTYALMTNNCVGKITNQIFLNYTNTYANTLCEDYKNIKYNSNYQIVKVSRDHYCDADDDKDKKNQFSVAMSGVVSRKVGDTMTIIPMTIVEDVANAYSSAPKSSYSSFSISTNFANNITVSFPEITIVIDHHESNILLFNKKYPFRNIINKSNNTLSESNHYIYVDALNAYISNDYTLPYQAIYFGSSMYSDYDHSDELLGVLGCSSSQDVFSITSPLFNDRFICCDEICIDFRKSFAINIKAQNMIYDQGKLLKIADLSAFMGNVSIKNASLPVGVDFDFGSIYFNGQYEFSKKDWEYILYSPSQKILGACTLIDLSYKCYPIGGMFILPYIYSFVLVAKNDMEQILNSKTKTIDDISVREFLKNINQYNEEYKDYEYVLLSSVEIYYNGNNDRGYSLESVFLKELCIAIRCYSNLFVYIMSVPERENILFQYLIMNVKNYVSGNRGEFLERIYGISMNVSSNITSYGNLTTDDYKFYYLLSENFTNFNISFSNPIALPSKQYDFNDNIYIFLIGGISCFLFGILGCCFLEKCCRAHRELLINENEDV